MDDNTERKLSGFFKTFLIIGATAYIVARIYSPATRKADKYDALMKDLNTIVEEYEGALPQLKELDTEDSITYELMQFVVLDIKTAIDNNK